MKKLLVLGATENQVPLIRAARAAGLHVVVCDWTTTNPGIALAHKHYQVSTMDLDEVLRVARDERVDGVITNSEPAVYNMTVVANELGLPGNSIESIEAMVSKYGFREKLKKSGLLCPDHRLCHDAREAISAASQIGNRIVVKPNQSSASRGTTLCEATDADAIAEAARKCCEISRDHRCVVEQYVDMPSLLTIEGEIFVYNGEFIWDGLLMTGHSAIEPFVPMTLSFPIRLSPGELQVFKRSMMKLFKEMDVTFGEFDVEAYFTRVGELFFIEVNPRQGGARLPELVREYSGVDFPRLLVTLAVGDESYFRELQDYERQRRYLSSHLVYSYVAGVYKGIEFDSLIKPHVFRVEEKVQPGASVSKCRSVAEVVALVSLEFDSLDDQMRFDSDLESRIRPIVLPDSESLNDT